VTIQTVRLGNCARAIMLNAINSLTKNSPILGRSPGL
jgi:hypothetical protein